MRYFQCDTLKQEDRKMVYQDVELTDEEKKSDRQGKFLNFLGTLLFFVVFVAVFIGSLFLIVRIPTSNNPIVNPSVYERLNEVLNNELTDIEYELAVLKELRDYLRSCYTTKNYDELANVFSLLIIILYLHNNRRKQSSNEVEVYKCGISGINCIPVPVDNYKVEQCKEAIDVGLQRIRRK